MDLKNQTTQWILIGIGALIILAGGWWVMTRNNAATPALVEDASTASGSVEEGSGAEADTGTGAASSSGPSGTQAQTPASGEVVVVEDQAAGSSVVVASASLTKPSWIAIKDAAGWILGARRFDMTSVPESSIPLLRATEAGKIYYAVIYVDDGDKAFDFKKDTVVVQAGTAVNDSFLAR